MHIYTLCFYKVAPTIFIIWISKFLPHFQVYIKVHLRTAFSVPLITSTLPFTALISVSKQWQ